RVGVKIRRHDFATFTRQRAIAPPTNEERTLRNVARELLSRWLAEHAGAKLRLLGVVLTDLSPASQLGLFDGAPEPRLTGTGKPQGTTGTAGPGASQAGAATSTTQAHVRTGKLDSTLDEVRARFGRGALRRGNTID